MKLYLKLSLEYVRITLCKKGVSVGVVKSREKEGDLFTVTTKDTTNPTTLRQSLKFERHKHCGKVDQNMLSLLNVSKKRVKEVKLVSRLATPHYLMARTLKVYKQVVLIGTGKVVSLRRLLDLGVRKSTLTGETQYLRGTTLLAKYAKGGAVM